MNEILIAIEQVRDSDALTADEVQSVLNKTSATPIPTSPTRMRSFMHKVTRLWRKPSPPATLSAVADDCEAAAPSSTAELTVVDVSRSSFSSGTSSNSCSADSDVSLWYLIHSELIGNEFNRKKNLKKKKKKKIRSGCTLISWNCIYFFIIIVVIVVTVNSDWFNRVFHRALILFFFK